MKTVRMIRAWIRYRHLLHKYKKMERKAKKEKDEIDKALKLSEAYGVQWTAINHYEEFCDIRSTSIWRRRRPLSKKEIEKMLKDF